MCLVCCAGLVQRAAGLLFAARSQERDVTREAKLLLDCLLQAKGAATQASAQCLQVLQVLPAPGPDW